MCGAGDKRVGDTWSSRKRRLSVLAEAFSRALDRQQDAEQALDAAKEIPFGFAGYQAPACLTLAESIRIVRAFDTPAIDAALDAARIAAHNIQASTFCARMTARVNALRERFWPLAAPLPLLVHELVTDASGELSAGLHVVGEGYPGRTGPRTLALDPELRKARTLAQLASAYRRPLRSVLQLNVAEGGSKTHRCPMAGGSKCRIRGWRRCWRPVWPARSWSIRA